MISLFILALTGPLNPNKFTIGCELVSWSTIHCYQTPGQKTTACSESDSGSIWQCKKAHPKYLQWDFDGDLDVDLRDYAILQNSY